MIIHAAPRLEYRAQDRRRHARHESAEQQAAEGRARVHHEKRRGGEERAEEKADAFASETVGDAPDKDAGGARGEVAGDEEHGLVAVEKIERIISFADVVCRRVMERIKRTELGTDLTGATTQR